MEKRKVQEAVAEWQAEKRRRVEDGEEEAGEADDDDVEDVQVCLHDYTFTPLSILSAGACFGPWVCCMRAVA